MVKVIKPFCWDQNFDPKVLSAPVPGLYTHEKTLKNVYKIRVQRDFSKLATNDQNDKAFLLTLICFFSHFHTWPGPYGLRRLFDKLRLGFQVSVYRTTGPLVFPEL